MDITNDVKTEAATATRGGECSNGIAGFMALPNATAVPHNIYAISSRVPQNRRDSGDESSQGSLVLRRNVSASDEPPMPLATAPGTPLRRA